MLSCITSRHKLLWEHATSRDPHLVDGGRSRHAVALGAVGDHGTAAGAAARINLSGRPSVGDHRRAAGYAPRHGGKWRTRFAAHGLDRLQDAPRPGSPRRYDEDTEQRLIDSVSQPPPGHATRTAALLAETLGEVSVH